LVNFRPTSLTEPSSAAVLSPHLRLGRSLGRIRFAMYGQPDRNRSGRDQLRVKFDSRRTWHCDAVQTASEQRSLRSLERAWSTHSLPTISGGLEFDTDGFLEIYKTLEVHSLISSTAVQFTPVLLSYLPSFRPGAVVTCSSSRHTISSCSSKLLSPSSPSGFSPSTP